MKKFVLQWHITHKCNLRCKHCYQEDYSCDLDLNNLEKIFYQFLDFCKVNNFKGHINFTGGEPFVSKYLYNLCDLCEKNKMTFGILTNGTLLTNKDIIHLSHYNNLIFIQVSIDGVPKTHNNIRGKGSFEKTIKTCQLLKKYNIQTMVSFTAHKQNYKELHKVIKIIKKNKIDRFWADRFIPIDNNKDINDKMVLSNEEFHLFIKTLANEKKKANRNPFCKTIIHTNRALQFCYDKETIYQCSAGISLLTILANGTLLPCRRLPISIGNVLEKDIMTLYNNSEIIKDLNKRECPNECKKCLYQKTCKGGAKCLTYAITKDYNNKDINCIF